jgi:hypothetical protein
MPGVDNAVQLAPQRQAMTTLIGLSAGANPVTQTRARQDGALLERTGAALRKAVEFYRTKVPAGAGYHFAYAEDLSYGRSEMSEGPSRVEVQRDGTPSVGMASLTA